MNETTGGNKVDNTALNLGNLDSMFGDMFKQEANPVQENNTQESISEEEEKRLGNVENISNVSLDLALQKLNNIEMELNSEFIEREELIKIMILALVTNSNLLMLGQPGTGKSKIAKALCNRIENGNYFEYMLNKTSDPSEILGPFSVKEMENDHFIRNVTGKLPEANIAFIDEVYKSNAPTLNALLTIMNEHIFYNDGKPVSVPLISMFAASNEPPEDDSLLAMHDRFLFRMNVQYLHDASSKKKMFNNFIASRNGTNNNLSYTTITIDELKLLQNESFHVFVPKNVINNFIDLLRDLSKNSNINISDRRANECLKVMQGSAIVHGRKKVTFEDFKALQYVLWSKDDDLDAISSALGKMINPYDDNFNKYLSNFNEIKQKISNASSEDERNRMYFQFQNSLKSLITKLNKLIAEASASGADTTMYAKTRDDIVQYNADLVSKTLGNSFSMNASNDVTLVDDN